MSVTKIPLPENSRLWAKHTAGDFLDGYAVKSGLSPRAALELGLSLPGWAKKLMALRNALVKPLGLKTGSDGGEVFPVEYEGPDEIIVGTDDRHLNFRIAIAQSGGRVYMATWVHRNNLLGRVYLALIMPFHVLIVRDSMRRIARGGGAA
ncbi:MAG: hypothetical protein CR993_02960 [Rhodobacterales bacterium]|nr:MAG: hypothetical protein CR993_02960 [Rhodobacterales bacterium]